jgi:hypothetical protein
MSINFIPRNLIYPLCVELSFFSHLNEIGWLKYKRLSNIPVIVKLKNDSNAPGLQVNLEGDVVFLICLQKIDSGTDGR